MSPTTANPTSAHDISGLPSGKHATTSAGPTQHRGTPRVTIEPNRDESRKMLAAVWRGSGDVRVEHVPRPVVTDPQDVVLRVTSTAICGSDLHLYHKEIMGMERGDILGHEFMGIVESVGPEVRNITQGQRVVACFDIACGECDYCQRQEFSSCDATNDSATMEKMYGHRSAGIYGYSHLTGGYPGGQAEYVRIPFADMNCLPVPNHLPDENLLFLSDILATAWHANELGSVSENDTVAIWGAGPVGLLATMLALQLRKARKVILIDNVPARLHLAREKLQAKLSHPDQLITINFKDHDVLEMMKQVVPGGPDVAIDAAGFRYVKTTAQRIQRATMMQTDSCDVLTEAIMSVRKNGRISIVADYVGYTNQFPIGALMEKGLTIRSGQTPVQKYWKYLLHLIESNTIDPTFIITHHLPLEKASHAYRIFDRKEDGCVKVVLKPPHSQEQQHGSGGVKIEEGSLATSSSREQAEMEQGQKMAGDAREMLQRFGSLQAQEEQQGKVKVVDQGKMEKAQQMAGEALSMLERLEGKQGGGVTVEENTVITEDGGRVTVQKMAGDAREVLDRLTSMTESGQSKDQQDTMMTEEGGEKGVQKAPGSAQEVLGRLQKMKLEE